MRITLENAVKDWPGLFADIFPKQGQESEREREDRLNKHTRNVAKSVHTRPLLNDCRTLCQPILV